MKNVKTVKAKTTKASTKGSAVEAPAALNPAAKRTVKAKPAESARASAPEPVRNRVEISNDLIAQRAYVLWEQQGCPQGHDLANWLQAEQQLKREIHSFTA